MVHLRLYRWPSQSPESPAWGILYASEAAHEGLRAALVSAMGEMIELPVRRTIDEIFSPGAVREQWRWKAEHRGAVIVHNISRALQPQSPPPVIASTKTPTRRDLPAVTERS